MTRLKKYLLWIGLALSLPVSGYCFMGTISYAWLNAVEPERWPAERAAIWAYSSLALAIIFLSVFIYCLVCLIRETNRSHGKNKIAT